MYAPKMLICEKRGKELAPVDMIKAIKPNLR